MDFISIAKNLKLKVKFWSTGKPFDPRDQVRTDGVDDIIKKREARGEYKKVARRDRE